MVITTEFGKEAPKRIGDYAITKILNNPNLSTDEKLAETKKWAEGGIYRIALHTITAALAIGTIEGAISAGTTAYAIPKIDEYLTKQGFDETTRQTALLALSAALGTTIGDSTASTVNNVGQTRWNYLLHSQIAQWEKQIAACRNQTCKDQVIQKYLALSDQQQKNLNNVCVINYNAIQCENLRKQYFAMSETLTQTHFNKLGGTNYWLHVENENQQAESIWRNVALSNPN
ncbi:hypothetical protein B0189_11150, partial [Moraxella cuniculi]